MPEEFYGVVKVVFNLNKKKKSQTALDNSDCDLNYPRKSQQEEKEEKTSVTSIWPYFFAN